MLEVDGESNGSVNGEVITEAIGTDELSSGVVFVGRETMNGSGGTLRWIGKFGGTGFTVVAFAVIDNCEELEESEVDEIRNDSRVTKVAGSGKGVSRPGGGRPGKGGTRIKRTVRGSRRQKGWEGDTNLGFEA